MYVYVYVYVRECIDNLAQGQFLCMASPAMKTQLEVCTCPWRKSCVYYVN